ncbi:flavin reductase family protein [Streptomyces sp. NPDC047046]|uniref:flavin reductase family protein n=1 Tax=Streptomyces sp. NPDC047046 TaxID=3155378 RepID=UPI0033E35DB4
MSPVPTATPAPAKDFRHVLGHVPTSVCVVTATGPQGPVGLTVGSFASVSLDPPLVVFYATRTSASAAAVLAAGRFCVNVLADDQEHVCASFARRGADRFAVGDWELTGRCAPRLAGAAAWIECELEEARPAGDHLAVLGRVRELAAAEGRRGPLVFHRGRLAGLATRGPGAARPAPVRCFDWWED